MEQLPGKADAGCDSPSDAYAQKVKQLVKEQLSQIVGLNKADTKKGNIDTKNDAVV